ncbi:MAG: asparagine--tRNA ligase [Chitinophagales bacterium]|nr:asparagine--tRNA ligase [Chitinophagales bacterium]
MNTVSIKDVYNHENEIITLSGWVSNKRSGKGLYFIILRDGSGFCQCVVDEKKVGAEFFLNTGKLTMESSCKITGKVVKDDRQIGGYEVQADSVEIISIAEEYPISKKEHGVDFLMDNRHLWLRSQRQWAIMRIRNSIILAIHSFFKQENFIQTDAPIFTGNAVEGTSTLFETDFYGAPAYLSQSGQLYGEAMAMAFGKIYTFGPTFRAEKSKTRRHLSEFWMIEPEMAFYDLDMNMDLIEAFIKYIVRQLLSECKNEFEIIERDIHVLESTVNKKFPRLTYDETVQIIKGQQNANGKNSIGSLEDDLNKVNARINEVQNSLSDIDSRLKNTSMKKGEITFNQNKTDQLRNELKDLEEDARNIPLWMESAKNFEYGNDLGGSDETVITRLFDVPVMVYNWPHAVKAFYLKRDADPRWAKGVDLLAPEGYGEIVGGGERETDINLLKEKIIEHKLPMQAFEWYLDLRRYGSVPHSGFGLGLERLVAWVCKLPHVRETIPFPRMYGRLEP